MLLEMDNKGVFYLANNWSVGGRTRHVEVRNYFLRDLKDEGLLVVKHVAEDDNEKHNRSFEKQIPMFFGQDKYMDGEAFDTKTLCR